MPPTTRCMETRRGASSQSFAFIFLLTFSTVSKEFRNKPGPATQHQYVYGYAFSSRLSSLRKRQSVCSAISLCGLDLIKPASYSRTDCRGALLQLFEDALAVPVSAQLDRVFWADHHHIVASGRCERRLSGRVR